MLSIANKHGKVSQGLRVEIHKHIYIHIINVYIYI